jgi:hypothetical protein
MDVPVDDLDAPSPGVCSYQRFTISIADGMPPVSHTMTGINYLFSSSGEAGAGAFRGACRASLLDTSGAVGDRSPRAGAVLNEWLVQCVW